MYISSIHRYLSLGGNEMVRMSNGIEIIEIPEGAVKIYKNMGFEVVDGDSSVAVEEAVEEEPVYEEPGTPSEESGSDEFSDLLSKPISQWNQEEVKEFAAARGIDVSSAKSLKQAKLIIKDAIDEQEKSFMGE